MDVLEYREFCLSLPLTEESTPFDETTLVYKIAGKMYTLADMVDFDYINVKCDPAAAEKLREDYPDDVTPGRHMNKRHWNSLSTTGRLSDGFLCEQIRNSYKLVVGGLPRAAREEILPLLEQQAGGE